MATIVHVKMAIRIQRYIRLCVWIIFAIVLVFLQWKHEHLRYPQGQKMILSSIFAWCLVFAIVIGVGIAAYNHLVSIRLIDHSMAIVVDDDRIQWRNYAGFYGKGILNGYEISDTGEKSVILFLSIGERSVKHKISPKVYVHEEVDWLRQHLAVRSEGLSVKNCI